MKLIYEAMSAYPERYMKKNEQISESLALSLSVVCFKSILQHYKYTLEK